MSDLKLGDLVYCRPSYSYSRELDLRGRIGLVVETRKGDCKVFYDDLGSSFWLPQESVGRVRPGEVSPESFLGTLSELLHLLEATAFELEPDGRHRRLVVRHEAISYRVLDRIRDFLGPRFVDLKLAPFGMGEIQSTIEFK
ncbi:MAG: hypothetical protein HY652_15130 [Acidobacteria bacterium]|nr:hypothetical protein [Acidobacteriota bacterium]